MRVLIQESLGFSDSLKVEVRKAQKWVGEHPGWSALSLGASVGGVAISPFLGPIWGFAVGSALAALSYGAMKKAIAEGRWPG